MSRRLMVSFAHFCVTKSSSRCPVKRSSSSVCLLWSLWSFFSSAAGADWLPLNRSNRFAISVVSSFVCCDHCQQRRGIEVVVVGLAVGDGGAPRLRLDVDD